MIFQDRAAADRRTQAEIAKLNARIANQVNYIKVQEAELAELKKDKARLSAISKADTALLNELADCYFTRRCEGILELMMRADRKTTEHRTNSGQPLRAAIDAAMEDGK